MIPTYLRIHNFLSYRGPIEIDLAGVRIACLSGENGAGKSALLDAITWAIWGRARVNRDRDLIALNADTMEVTLRFILDQQECQIIRRRGRSGSGPLHLDVLIRHGDQYRSIAEETATDTQRIIDNLLRMDYETFINSAFLLQGRADEFTTRTPAQRKQVLAEILKLGDYDGYEEQARQEKRTRERRVQEIDAKLDELENTICQIPELEKRAAEQSDSLIACNEQLLNIADQIAILTDQRHQLDYITREAESNRQRESSLKQQLSAAESRIDELDRSIQKHRAVLATEDRIGARYERYTQVQQQSQEATRKLQQLQGLQQEYHRIEQEIAQQERVVERELAGIISRITEYDRRLSRMEELTNTLGELQNQVDNMGSPASERQLIDQQERKLRFDATERSTVNKQLRSEMDDLRGRLDQLTSGDARCPVCQQPLSPAERQRLELEYTSEGTSLAQKYRHNEARIRAIDGDLQEIDHQRKQVEQRQKRVEQIQQRISATQQEITAVEADRSARDTNESQRQALQKRIDNNEIASNERTHLAAIQEQINAIGYSAEIHKQLTRELSDLEPVVAEHRAIEQARTLIAPEQQQRSELSTRIADLQRELQAIEKALAEAADALKQHESLTSEITRLGDYRTHLEQERSAQQQALGATQQHLKTAFEAKDRGADLRNERDRLVDEIFIHDELSIAFGKRGIQAMIIENIVPDLQDESNRILDQMPGNRMRIEFRTQRQAVSGDRLIETLDIVISDEMGKRPYELYSGGEAFRINFAVRIALSKLLARRAGARLETLVIDEGFGTQDTQGRDGLIEAIRAVETDFEMILVITHIAELKEVFPTRIDVQKTNEGSVVQVL